MLKSNPTTRLWNFAFEKYFLARIETRYLQPIRSILRDDNYVGAGFSIVALFCTLVEFLESCEQGHNFHIPKTLGKKVPYKYGPKKAGTYFKAFFVRRIPFKNLVPSDLVDSLYFDVRCGLLHEARTKGGWMVSARHSLGALVERDGAKVILYRSQIVPALDLYFADYQRRLLEKKRTQAAFLRKFDHLAKA